MYVVLLLILVSIASFGLGRLSSQAESKSPVVVEMHEQAASASVSVEGRYVASQNGSKYHFPWCPSAQRISEQNKVWFDSKEEAERAGYTPASNCKGL
jgi:hypothetical protein